MKTIALEEHYFTRQAADAAAVDLSLMFRSRPTGVEELLYDVSSARLKVMDEAGIDVQVLSLTCPALQDVVPEISVPLARKTNCELRTEVIDQHPDRFAGFATLPTSDPNAAADELAWSVTELGLVGALINGRTQGLFLDHPRFDPILACAAEMGVPIYLHPQYPTESARNEFFSGLSEIQSTSLGAGGIGWHQELALHAVRLVISGVFDRYPELNIIIGHLGEGLPFYLGRITRVYGRPGIVDLKRPIQEYFLNNFWLTISGFTDDHVLELALKTFGTDRMMFSTDCPYVDSVEVARWFDALTIDEDTRRKISYETASTLLKI